YGSKDSNLICRSLIHSTTGCTVVRRNSLSAFCRMSRFTGGKESFPPGPSPTMVILDVKNTPPALINFCHQGYYTPGRGKNIKKAAHVAGRLLLHLFGQKTGRRFGQFQLQ